MFYFQARVEQSVLFLLLSTFSSYYGAKPQTSRTRFPGDSRINARSWVPQKHTPCLYSRHKQDQPITLLSWVSRSPSKLGLQAPAPESRTQCGARISSTQNKTLTVGPERAGTHDKRVTSLPSADTQVCARDNKSVTCLASNATDGP